MSCTPFALGHLSHRSSEGADDVARPLRRGRGRATSEQTAGLSDLLYQTSATRFERRSLNATLRPLVTVASHDHRARLAAHHRTEHVIEQRITRPHDVLVKRIRPCVGPGARDYFWRPAEEPHADQSSTHAVKQAGLPTNRDGAASSVWPVGQLLPASDPPPRAFLVYAPLSAGI